MVVLMPSPMIIERELSSAPLPTLFLSHGAPTLPLDDIPAREFLKGLGPRFKSVGSILCISAHWETVLPTVGAVELPDTIHDFWGFPQELYRMKYPAKGSPELAARTIELIKSTGLDCEIDRRRGLDHGAWVPLMLMYPQAEVPVVQLSIRHDLDPMHHIAMGRAIAPLRKEGVLIIGSGGAVHPLGYAPLEEGAPTDPWAVSFSDWLIDAVTRGDEHALTNYKKIAPYPERAHPRPDHFMPLLVAFGAAGPGAVGKVAHHSWHMGDLGMDAFSFDDRMIVQ